MDDVVDRLRVRTIPSGYIPHPWTPGMYRSWAYIYTFSVLRTALFTDYVPLLTGKAEGLKDKLF